jgi:hypothetical protein
MVEVKAGAHRSRSETGTHLELEAFQAVAGLAFSGLA